MLGFFGLQRVRSSRQHIRSCLWLCGTRGPWNQGFDCSSSCLRLFSVGFYWYTCPVVSSSRMKYFATHTLAFQLSSYFTTPHVLSSCLIATASVCVAWHWGFSAPPLRPHVSPHFHQQSVVEVC